MTSHVFRLGDDDWLSAEFLEFTTDQDINVSSGSELHDEIVERLQDRSALYPDDGDGNLDASELSAGPVATPTDPN